MKLIATLILGLSCLTRVAAAPVFSPPAGHEEEELVSLSGDPSSWQAGIDACDCDDTGVYYISRSTLYVQPDAGSPQVLFTYDTDVYGSFVCLHGDEVYFGESSFGSVRSIAKSGGSSRLVFNLPPSRAPKSVRTAREFALAGNYACAFNSQSRMFLSANPAFSGNSIYCWTGEGEPFVIAAPGGYSGPLALDAADNLYYGCFLNYPAGPENIVVWNSAQLETAVAGGDVLGLMDAAVYASGVVGPSGLDFVGESLVASAADGSIHRIYSRNRAQEFGTVIAGVPGVVAAVDDKTAAFLVTDWSDYVSTVYRMDLEPQLSSSKADLEIVSGGLGDSASYVSGMQSFDYDDEGNLYAFVGTQYLVKNPGFSAQTLYEFPSPYYFGSFVRVRGDTVYFGESSTNRVFSAPVDGSSPGRLLFELPGGGMGKRMRTGEEFTLVGNYDCAFDSLGRMFLSANPSSASYEPNNKIYCWEGQTGIDPVVVAEMGGYSGPLSVDPSDNLYYGFDSAVSPQVVGYGPAQVNGALASGTPLVPAEAFAWMAQTGEPCTGMCWLDGEILCSSYQGDLFSCAADGRLEILASVVDGNTNPSALAVSAAGAPAVLVTSYDNYNSAVYLCSRTEPAAATYGYYRPENSLWNLHAQTRFYFGRSGDDPLLWKDASSPSPLPAVFRSDQKLWVLQGLSRFYFGRGDDDPVPADYSNTGTDTAAIFRPDVGLWKIRGLTSVYFGREGDDPLPGNWEGRGARPTYFRDTSGLWSVLNLTRFYFGRSGDTPLAVDPWGNGQEVPAYFRPDSGLWKVRGVTRFYFGGEGDVPLAGDFSGDGSDDFAFFRPAQGLWKIRGITRFYQGREGDVPVVE